MAGADTLTLSDDTFEQEVLKSTSPVLVDFWAEWCGPCRTLAPVIDDLATEYAGKLKVGKLDIDANQNTALKYGIQSIPTILLFVDGEVAHKLIGLQPKSSFKKLIDELLAA